MTRNTFISLAYQILNVDTPFIFPVCSQESIWHFQGIIQNSGRQWKADDQPSHCTVLQMLLLH